MGHVHAIVGGGVAGSRLAARLVEAGHGSVLLVDALERDPRTLALFADPDGWSRDFAVHRWPRITVRARGRTLTRQPSRSYVIVKAQALRDHARTAVEAAGGAVVRGRVQTVLDGSEGCTIVLEDGRTFEADWVYDSRVHPDDDDTALRQTFTGVWVESEEPAFDPDEAILMDFDRFAHEGRGPSQGVRFVHTLPTSPTRALITAVSIGPGRPKLPVGTWLPGVLPDSAHTVVGHESGSTPLMTERPVRWAAPRRLRVGNAGGLLKASTGYAVQRIDDDAAAIVASIGRRGRPDVPRRLHAVPWRWLDRVFLDLVAQRGQASAAVFLAMFERRPID
ncbi:MAG: lycopene cyclase family protein, partial [Myxococcota bacterium]